MSSTHLRIHNAMPGRRGAPYSSVEILAAAITAGSARMRADGCVQWNQDAGRNIHHEYVAAMRREEREFADMPDCSENIPEGSLLMADADYHTPAGGVTYAS